MGNNTDGTINRYTSLASVVHLLSERRLTLLDPSTWDDKNDVHFMETYKARKSGRNVFALCFSRAPHTYHHWRVFAPGPDGVCIAFYEDKLRDVLNVDSQMEFEDVKYCSLPEARKKKVLAIGT